MSEIADFLINLISAGKFEDSQKPDIERTKWVSEKLKSIGCECDFKIFDDTANVCATIGNKNAKKSLCFCGHCDVVPARNWTKKISGEIIGNRVYGRGAVDMLGEIACWFFALKCLKEKSELLNNIKIITLLTGDEEGAGINGTDKMVKYLVNKGENIDACIVGEPTSDYYDLKSHKDVDNCKLNGLCYSRGGSFHFWITVKGKSGHVAYTGEFDNPITKAVRLCDRLKKISFTEFDEKMTNLEIVEFNAVNNTDNVILDDVKIHGNVRFFCNKNRNIDYYNIIKQKIENECQAVLFDRYNARYQCDRCGYTTDVNDDFLQLAMSCFKRYNNESKFVVVRACTDGEYMTKICKSVCEIGLKCKMMHQIDEYTTIEDLNDLTNLYKEIITEYAK